MKRTTVLLGILLLMLGAGCGAWMKQVEGGRQSAGGGGTDAGRAAEPADRELDDNAVKLDACVRKGPGGRNVISPECIRQDISVLPGMKAKDLGTVGMATFEIVGDVALDGLSKTIRRSHADSMEVTDTIMRRLLGAGIPLVERDRRLTDKLLEELHVSASELVDSETAPSIGHQLGVKTLIVGRFEFSGEFEFVQDENGDVILKKPKSIGYQAVRIKALDVSRGQVIIDARFSMTGSVVSVLMPQTLARYAATEILSRLGADAATF